MQTLTSLRDFVLCAKKVLTFVKLKLCERQQLQNGSIANITYLLNCSLLNIHPFILPNLERPAYVTDMIFVKKFTLPDFQAKNFTPQKCVICDIFSRELTV